MTQSRMLEGRNGWTPAVTSVAAERKASAARAARCGAEQRTVPRRLKPGAEACGAARARTRMASCLLRVQCAALAVLFVLSPNLAAEPTAATGKAAPAQAGVAGFEINFGLSGPWFEPATSGQGFLLDVVPSAQILSFGWFTYGLIASDGSAAAQRWLTGVGGYSADTATTTLYLSEGGAFNSLPSPESVEVGTLLLRFSDCTHATADYSVRRNAISGMGDPAAGEMLTGTIELQRLTPDQSCAQPTRATEASASAHPTSSGREV